MLALVVVAIMLGFPTAFTLMGMGMIFTWFAYDRDVGKTLTLPLVGIEILLRRREVTLHLFEHDGLRGLRFGLAEFDHYAPQYLKAMAQAGNGSVFLQQIIRAEVAKFVSGEDTTTTLPINLVVRTRFNPNLNSVWFSSVMQIINNITIL